MKRPSRTASSHAAAIRYLKRADPVLARVVTAVGPCRFETRAAGSHFDAVARAIVFQQLSGKAAATIHSRYYALYEQHGGTPKSLLRIPDEALRASGLSRQKIAYLKDLARLSSTGELEVDRLHELEDEDLIAQLTKVKGIGKWTAHMFLMFRLGRPNVLPTLDLGIQKAVQRAYGLRKMPKPEKVESLGRAWAPHCTLASWYLWRSLEVPAPKSPAAKRPAAKKRKAMARTKSRRA